MVSSLTCPGLVLAIVFVLTLLHSTESKCSSDQIECRTGGECIPRFHICDGNQHCSDGSDEARTICELWPPMDSSCRHPYSNTNKFLYQGNCFNIYEMCSNSRRSSTLNPKVCQIVLQSKLVYGPNEFSNEVVALLSSAVNSTLTQKKPNCPMLYTRVGEDCLSFFSPAKVSWPEARQFCRSIYGDLWQFKDIIKYEALLAFIREERFTSEYWIGGRFDLDTNAWAWTTDNTVMPLGAPYWTVKQTDLCVPRGPPHTDPFSDPPTVQPGARCYHTELSPRKRASGWCAAMTYENYYYWSDEMCEDTFSPLCVFTGPTGPAEADRN